MRWILENLKIAIMLSLLCSCTQDQWKGSRSDGSFHQEYTWIKPYQKGKDFGEQLNKKYMVGGPDINANDHGSVNESNIGGSGDKPSFYNKSQNVDQPAGGDGTSNAQSDTKRQERRLPISIQWSSLG
jgi:hypothetical protein